MLQVPRILLVEDDRGIAGALAQALSTSYIVDVAQTGKMAYFKCETEDYEVIVLDLNLPDLSGLIVCQQLRRQGVNTPIIILSGESKVLTKINLLDAGANDYLTKPFSLGELKARLRVVARPKRDSIFEPNVNKLVVEELTLDRQKFVVHRGSIEIFLRRKEFALLECLMEHAGIVVTRDRLVRSVWQTPSDLWTNTIDVHIKNLRDKIDRPFNRPLIRTVHGLGYKIEVAPAAVIRQQ